MKKKYFVHGWKDARLLFSDERLLILGYLKDAPLSVSRLAELMNLNAGSVHNHLKKLESIGAIKTVEVESKGGRGAPEKNYRCVAEEVRIGKLDEEDRGALNLAIAKRMHKDAMVVLEHKGRARRYDGYLTKEQHDKMVATLEALAEEFASTPKGNQRPYRFTYCLGHHS